MKKHLTARNILYIEAFIGLLALGVVVDPRGFWTMLFSGLVLRQVDPPPGK